MRTIKFRGKAENGWHYGDLRTDTSNGDCTSICDGITPRFDCEVNPTTVGQFTGLLDKNGKEIYEGDIVKDINDELQQVRWFCSGWGLQRLTDGERWGWCVVPGYDKEREFVEIVGNIYDNPELLSK